MWKTLKATETQCVWRQGRLLCLIFMSIFSFTKPFTMKQGLHWVKLIGNRAGKPVLCDCSCHEGPNSSRRNVKTVGVWRKELTSHSHADCGPQPREPTPWPSLKKSAERWLSLSESPNSFSFNKEDSFLMQDIFISNAKAHTVTIFMPTGCEDRWTANGSDLIRCWREAAWNE